MPKRKKEPTISTQEAIQRMEALIKERKALIAIGDDIKAYLKEVNYYKRLKATQKEAEFLKKHGYLNEE